VKLTKVQNFYPRDAMRKRVFAVVACLSASLSHDDIVSKRLNLLYRKTVLTIR